MLEDAATGRIDDGGGTATLAAASLAGHLEGGVSALEPPPGGSHADNAGWYATLSDTERFMRTASHPELIGNLDGIPAEVRDAANRARIPDERAAIQAEVDRLSEIQRHSEPSLELGRDLQDARNKLDALDAIDETLHAEGTDRQLLVLDSSGERLKAAVANGNVDTAEHVAVFTPGLTSNVQSSIGGYSDEMDLLRREAQIQSVQYGDGGDVATVAWIGYEAPQLREPSTPPTQSPAKNRHAGVQRASPGSSTASTAPVPTTRTSPRWATPTAPRPPGSRSSKLKASTTWSSSAHPASAPQTWPISTSPRATPTCSRPTSTASPTSAGSAPTRTSSTGPPTSPPASRPSTAVTTAESNGTRPTSAAAAPANTTWASSLPAPRTAPSRATTKGPETGSATPRTGACGTRDQVDPVEAMTIMLLAALAGCTAESGGEDVGTPGDTLHERPDIEQITANYQQMQTQMRERLSAEVGPLEWAERFGEAGRGCGFDFEDVDGAVSKSLPTWVSDGNLPDADWDRASAIVAEIAASQGFAQPREIVDRPDDHQVRISDPYGGELIFGTAKNTILSVSTGCHLIARAHTGG